MNLPSKETVEAINFILNFPPKVKIRYYSVAKDVWIVDVLVDGWHTIKLNGSLVRAAVKWKGMSWEANSDA